MNDDGSEIGAFFAGFVIGGLVGAATALILAPQSGEETRAQIAAKSDELRRAGEQQLTEYREIAGGAVDDARGRLSESTAQAQEQARIVLDEGRTKVSQAMEKSKANTSEAQEDVEGQKEQDEPVEGDATS